MSESMLAVVRSRLVSAGRSEWPAIHAATKVPLSSIEKIAYGVHDDPRISTVEPLYRYFEAQAAA